MKLMPTYKQWKKWSLPSKLSAVGTAVGVLGLGLTVLLSLVPFFSSIPLGDRLRGVLSDTYFGAARGARQDSLFFLDRNNLYLDRPDYLHRQQLVMEQICATGQNSSVLERLGSGRYSRLGLELLCEDGKPSSQSQAEFLQRQKVKFEFFSDIGESITEQDMLGFYYFVMVYQPMQPCNRHVGITKRISETLRPYVHTDIDHILVNISAYSNADSDSVRFQKRYGLRNKNFWLSKTQLTDWNSRKLSEHFVADMPTETYFPYLFPEDGVIPKLDKSEIGRIREMQEIWERQRSYSSELRDRDGSSVFRTIRAYWSMEFSRESGDYSQIAGLINADGTLIGLLHLGHDNEQILALDDLAVVILQDIASEHPELLLFDRLTINALADAKSLDDLKGVPIYRDIKLALASEETRLASLEADERLDVCHHG